MWKHDNDSPQGKVLASGWLKEKTPEFQDAVLREARIRRYEGGQYTHHIGDDPGGFYGIADGSFGVITQSPTMGTVMGHIMRRGDWFGQRPMVIGKSRSLAFRAMEEATVFYISLQAVETVSQSLPEARWQFASLAEHNLETTIRVISDLLIRRSDRRIAAVLLRVAGVPDDGRSRDFHKCSLTQSDLAELANVSRHLVNATLKAFEDRGWIKIGYGKMSVLNAKALRAFLSEE
jgi:CRP/FNR family cyclic AMP-dependent transcriptional regulator